MDPKYLKIFAVGVYGEAEWCARLAADLSLSESHVRNLRAGRRPWTPATRDSFRALLDATPARLGSEHVARMLAVAEARLAADAAWGPPWPPRS